MLTILTGRAGCGKTAEVMRRMKERGGERPQLLLTPEQASFETERRYCEENGNGAGLYGEVLSFTRLENRVLSLAGGGAEPVLDEGGRLLVMYAALKSVASHLTAYAMPSRRPEFLNSLLLTVDELKSGCVTAADLLRVGEETEGLSGEKLRDLGLIIGAYEAMTERGALDPRDRLTRLAEKLRGFPYFRGRDVYLDGFTDFTPQQGLVLEQILKQSNSVTVTLTDGDGEGEEAVFAPAKKTMAWLSRLAGKTGQKPRRETLPEAAGKRNPALTHLEQQLFSKNLPPYSGAWDDSVTFGALPNAGEEVRWTAGEIRKLVQSGQYRCRDIIVTARSMEPYMEWLDCVFAEYEIPLFQSEKTDLLQKPIFTLLTAAMDAVNGGYQYEDMFRYLKTGLTGIPANQCDRLENYVLTWDLWGGKWLKTWGLHPGGYNRKRTEEDAETLEELNALRTQVIEPLETLRKTAGNTVGEQVQALYRFLESIALPERLEERADRLLKMGEPELAREYSQLWGILCEGLTQCFSLLGEMETSFGEFSRLLRLLLSRYSVGSIPASLDRVTAGDAQRISNRQGKVLFLLGAEEGMIPQITTSQGLLSDADRILLEGYDLEPAPRMEERMCREHTIVYTTCSQPEERLYVTWPSGGEGGEKRPSHLIERLRKLFPMGEKMLVSPGSASMQGRRTPKGTWGRGRLSRRAVRLLYGEQVAMSASRLDRYKSCHFGYFMEYGLEARERRPAGFHAPEYGTFLHFVLEQVLREVKKQGGIETCPDDRVREMTKEAVRLYTETRLGGMEQQTARFRYLFRRLEKSVLAIVENIVAELRVSDFQPLAFELGFGYETGLPPVEMRRDGITLQISGIVDRVDGWEKDGRLYLRVVDYKTGRKSFDLTEIWNGLGLQMLLYLFALEEMGAQRFGEKPTPAGVLYLPARQVMVEAERDASPEILQQKIDRALERDGLLLEDEDVLEAMEHRENGLRFLPLKVKKDGTIRGDALVSLERLGKLKTHVQSILGQICQELAAGNLEADPFWRGPQKNACQYCDYFRACQFEEGRDRVRYIPTVKNGEFWDRLEEKEGEGYEENG